MQEQARSAAKAKAEAPLLMEQARRKREKRIPYPVCKFVCPEGFWLGREEDAHACRCP